jgi:hypothetical protein
MPRIFYPEEINQTNLHHDSRPKLLINIAFYFQEQDKCLSCQSFTNHKHFSAEFRLTILVRTLQTFLLYPWNIKIFIDTNSEVVKNKLVQLGILDSRLTVVHHTDLKHPFLLTCIHRKRIQNLFDEFDYFFYTEDDMIIPFSSLVDYFQRMELLWPEHSATFVRFEPLDETKKISVDAISPSKRLYTQIIKLENRSFINLDNFYCACWGLSKNHLKKFLFHPQFLIDEYSINVREMAASFPTFQLEKIGFIEIDSQKFQVLPSNLIEHAGRRFLTYKSPPFGTINIDQLFEFS